LPGEAPAATAGGKPKGARPRGEPREPAPDGDLQARPARRSGTGAPPPSPRSRPVSETPSAPASKPAPHKGAAPKIFAPPKAGPGAPAAGSRLARRDPAATGLTPTAWAPPGTRHPAGLAIDVAMLHKRDGRWLSVQRDFHGRLGEKTCGEGARTPDGEGARELRALVCESREPAIFTYVLTPDFNAAHADHFHMEIKPGVRWFLYH
jgi:hypothetical protein